jgi:hypothetical protein
MGSEYEMLVDRGVELEKELCNAGGGELPPTLSQPAGWGTKSQEQGRSRADFDKRMKEQWALKSQEPGKARRVYIDMFRLAGSCGHGM